MFFCTICLEVTIDSHCVLQVKRRNLFLFSFFPFFFYNHNSSFFCCQQCSQWVPKPTGLHQRPHQCLTQLPDRLKFLKDVVFRHKRSEVWRITLMLKEKCTKNKFFSPIPITLYCMRNIIRHCKFAQVPKTMIIYHKHLSV